MNESEKLSEKHQKFEDAVRAESSRRGGYGSSTRHLDAFQPEGRVKIPLNTPDIKLDGKKEVAFVDTLAMQTKLGVRNRAMEMSMSSRDSDIVKKRNIVAATPFTMGESGTAVLLVPPLRMQGRATPQSLDVQGAPLMLDVAGMDREKAKELDRKFWESPERQSPLPPASQVQPVECAVPERPASVVPQAPVAVPASPIPAVEAVATVVLTTPIPDPLPTAPEGSVAAEETVDLKKKVEEYMALLARAEELEAENAVLLQIITRLAAENKALKAKK